MKFTASLIVGALVYLFRSQIASVFLKDTTLEYLVLPDVILAVFSIFELSKPVVTEFGEVQIVFVQS